MVFESQETSSPSVITISQFVKNLILGHITIKSIIKLGLAELNATKNGKADAWLKIQR